MIVPKEIVDGNVVYKVTSITASAFNSQEGSDTEVNKVILPETEEPLQIEEGAMIYWCIPATRYSSTQRHILIHTV